MNVDPRFAPALSTATLPVVQLDEPSHDRQAEAEPALRTIDRPLALCEQVEHVRQQVFGTCRCHRP